MLRACPCCSCYYRVEDGACPHCGSACAAKRRSRAALLLSLGLGAGGCLAQDLYGIARTDKVDVADADGDGWLSDEDCDDDDPEVYPDAPETAGDGVDSNCDGEDDT